MERASERVVYCVELKDKCLLFFDRRSAFRVICRKAVRKAEWSVSAGIELLHGSGEGLWVLMVRRRPWSAMPMV